MIGNKRMLLKSLSLNRYQSLKMRRLPFTIHQKTMQNSKNQENSRKKETRKRLKKRKELRNFLSLNEIELQLISESKLLKK